MSTPEENKRIVQQYWDALAVRDWEAMKALLTDDCHYTPGGNMRMYYDVGTYGGSMVGMNALPPLPELSGPNWADLWKQRLETNEPYLVTWIQNQVDAPYWRHASLRPVAASDDGVQMRITFSDRAEMPAIFVRNEDDSESLLNFSVDAGDVVIHRLAPKLILRRGRLTGCIVNGGFSGVGSRLESGTVSPQVERDVKGER